MLLLLFDGFEFACIEKPPVLKMVILPGKIIFSRCLVNLGAGQTWKFLFKLFAVLSSSLSYVFHLAAVLQFFLFGITIKAVINRKCNYTFGNKAIRLAPDI